MGEGTASFFAIPMSRLMRPLTIVVALLATAVSAFAAATFEEYLRQIQEVGAEVSACGGDDICRREVLERMKKLMEGIRAMPGGPTQQDAWDAAQSALAHERDDPCYPVLLQKEFSRRWAGSDLPWVSCAPVMLSLTWDLTDRVVDSSDGSEVYARYILREQYPGYLSIVRDQHDTRIIYLLELVGPSPAKGRTQVSLESIEARFLAEVPTPLGSAYRTVTTTQPSAFDFRASNLKFEYNSYPTPAILQPETILINPPEVAPIPERIVPNPGKLVKGPHVYERGAEFFWNGARLVNPGTGEVPPEAAEILNAIETGYFERRFGVGYHDTLGYEQWHRTGAVALQVYISKIDWCEEAKNMGLDKSDDAGVICIAGEAIPCIWIKSPIPEIDKCTLEHERIHISDIECPKVSSFETSVFPTRPTSRSANECGAYIKQLGCLQQKRSICSKTGVTTKACERNLDFYIGDAKKKIKSYQCRQVIP